LWRNGIVGKFDATKKRPGRMTDFIVAQGLLPADEVSRIEQHAPAELIDRAQAFANGVDIDSWDDVFESLPAAGCVAV
jgi:hypothetical protein